MSDIRRRICVVTACRSEYGLLRWLMDGIRKTTKFDLQVLVTGAHLSPEFGFTYKDIEQDGFSINARVDMLLSSDSEDAIAKSMGLCGLGCADSFTRLSPDLLIVLGDRYELLPICSTALVMRIPIAHISGGDITEGAIDDEIRNAITMMACIHFPGTEDSASRILKMGKWTERVFVVGEPGLDNFSKLPKMDRGELATVLGLDSNCRWALLTYHSETKASYEVNRNALLATLSCLMEYENLQVCATYANADPGGTKLNNLLIDFAAEHKDAIRLVSNLGQIRYVNMIRHANLMVGNSSSGIFETQLAALPVVNIGNRQKGRPRTRNIIDCPAEAEAIYAAIEEGLNPGFRASLDPDQLSCYGDGCTSEKIVDILSELSDSGAF